MMISAHYREIVRNGLWNQNPGLVQLLGLCPLLAISNSVVNALALGLATTLVMVVASSSVALVRNLIPHEIRIPSFVLIIAVAVTIVDLTMNAFVHPLYLVLGVFIPLITTNCIVLARVESFASRRSTAASALDAVMMGLGLTLVLGVLGALREVLGKGSLLSGLDLVLGPAGRDWVITVVPEYQGFLLALLPPGAFLGLGLIIALKNWIDALRAARRTPLPSPIQASA